MSSLSTMTEGVVDDGSMQVLPNNNNNNTAER